MKRTIFILFALFMLLSSGQLWAQEQKPYKPAATFKGDTLRYLEYNYTIRRTQYIGKTVGEILKELEYPVIYVSGVYQSGNGPSRLAGLYLVVRQTTNGLDELKGAYIRIWFANPPRIEEYNEASGRNSDNPFPALSKKLYNFIKDLKVSDISSNLYNLQDPVLKENQRRSLEKIYESGRKAGEEFEKMKREREAREAEEMKNQSSPEQ